MNTKNKTTDVKCKMYVSKKGHSLKIHNVCFTGHKVIQIWNNIAVNNWWLNFYFCVNYPIKTEKRGTSLIIQQPTIKSQCSVNERSETTANVNWHMRRMPLVKGQSGCVRDWCLQGSCAGARPHETFGCEVGWHPLALGKRCCMAPEIHHVPC